MMERLLFAKIEAWLVILLFVFSMGLFGAWGFAVVQWHIFPYGLVVEFKNFIQGDPNDYRSLWTRIKAEFVYSPGAFYVLPAPALVPAEKLSPVRVENDAGGILPDMNSMTFFSEDGPTRYFVVFGSFAFPETEAHWGAVAIDSHGTVHRGWAILPDRFEYGGAHIGLDITDEGQIVTNTHGVLTAYDWCGEKQWDAPWEPHPDGWRRSPNALDGYDWHHDVQALDGRIYTFRGPAVMTVDQATGDILSELHAIDLIKWGWRDNLHLFDARYWRRFEETELSRDTMVGIFHRDPFHFNKVEVLSDEKASLYPQFEAGDMLMSLRELNLVVIVRPSEERIVWWRYGLTSAQHDSSFLEGHVEVYDNNPHSVPPRPRIARLDLNTQQADTLFDLSRWQIEMRAHGNFERRGDRILTTDDYAGRMIAGRLDGSIDFLFENSWRRDDGEIVNLQLRDVTEVAPEAFAGFQESCAR